MTRKIPDPDKAKREAEKARRLAEALRANLARRKARSRSRAAGETESPAADVDRREPGARE